MPLDIWFAEDDSCYRSERNESFEATSQAHRIVKSCGLFFFIVLAERNGDGGDVEGVSCNRMRALACGIVKRRFGKCC